jgi:hypothetical protein
MKTTIHVAVTQTEINLGKVKLCTLCPVAIATKRAFAFRFGVDAAVWVGLDGPRDAVVMLDGFVIQLPRAVGQWVNLFDSGIKPEPIEFDMEIPNALLEGTL